MGKNRKRNTEAAGTRKSSGWQRARDRCARSMALRKTECKQNVQRNTRNRKGERRFLLLYVQHCLFTNSFLFACDPGKTNISRFLKTIICRFRSCDFRKRSFLRVIISANYKYPSKMAKNDHFCQ